MHCHVDRFSLILLTIIIGVEYEGSVAWLTMDVDEDQGLFEGYQLKLNSYDLGVDIELNRYCAA